MKLPLSGSSLSLTSLASWIRLLGSAIAAGFHVEHRENGTHALPWVRVGYVSAHFSGATTMTWTATTQTFLKYRLVDHTMTVSFSVSGTVGGTPTGALQILIPGNFRAVESDGNAYSWVNAGTAGTGIALVSVNQIQLFKDGNATAWSAGAAQVRGQIEFEVQ